MACSEEVPVKAGVLQCRLSHTILGASWVACTPCRKAVQLGSPPFAGGGQGHKLWNQITLVQGFL